MIFGSNAPNLLASQVLLKRQEDRIAELESQLASRNRALDNILEILAVLLKEQNSRTL